MSAYILLDLIRTGSIVVLLLVIAALAVAVKPWKYRR